MAVVLVLVMAGQGSAPGVTNSQGGGMDAVGGVVDFKDGTRQGVQVDAQGRLRLAALSAAGARGTYRSPVQDAGRAGAVMVDWLAQWTTPQRWVKHAHNPIYGPDQTGPWDHWCNGVSIVRNPDGETLKMYYAGRQGAGVGFAEGRLDAPTEWTEHPASPVLRPRTDNWEGNMLNQPRVVKVSTTHWRMYYTGWGLKDARGTPWAMGIAESHDTGVTWERLMDEPFMERGPEGAPDDGGACVPMVIRVGGLWYMWYTAMTVIPDRQSIHLCLATSKDGIHWDKHPGNPVLTDDFTQGPGRNVTSRCFVRHVDGLFQMWYSHARPDYRIRYAESLDGIHWERSPLQLALDASPAPAWDDQMVEYPEVDVVDGQWRLWFCGNGFGSVGFATGVPESTVQLSLRHGPSPTPGTGWSDWIVLERGQPPPVQRYVQVQAALESQSADYGPVLTRLAVQTAGDDH